MSEPLRQTIIALMEGILALAAVLAAIAFRRRRRMFTPAGFIMLAIGLTLDLMAPHGASSPDWAPYLRAAAIILLWFGVIRLGVECVEYMNRRRRIHVSTIATELILTVLYASVVVIVTRTILEFHIRRLVAVPALFTLIRAWLQQRDFFSGLLIQSRRPFRLGDWVRFGSQVGQVQETGWRSTRILTRAQESVTIPSGVLAKDVLTNYSSTGCVADEIFIGLSYGEAPGSVEEIVKGVLTDVPEVLKEPPPEASPWEYSDWSIRYRIKYWLDDYADQDAVRARIIRNLWYAMRRHSIEVPSPTHTTLWREGRNGAGSGRESEERLMQDLRKVDLLKELSDEDLRIMIPSVKLSQFGRGEVLIRQGETGDSFYVLRRGTVDVVDERAGSRTPMMLNQVDHLSEKNFFGEIALLKGEPRIATIRASTDVEVLEIGRNGFSHLFKARPEVAVSIAKIAAAREKETLALTSAAGINATVTEQENTILSAMRKIFDF